MVISKKIVLLQIFGGSSPVQGVPHLRISECQQIDRFKIISIAPKYKTLKISLKMLIAINKLIHISYYTCAA